MVSDYPSWPDGNGIPEAIPLPRPADEVGEARPVGWAAPVQPAVHPIYLLDSRRAEAWRDLGLFVFGAVACTLVMGIVGGLALALLSSFSGEEPDERMANVVLLPFMGLAWVVLIAAIVRGRRQSAASVGLSRGGLVVDIALGGAATAGAFLAFFVSIALMWLCWPEGISQMQDNQQAITEMLPPVNMAILCGLQLFVGLYEELAFRGFILPRLRRAVGSWWLAVLISSVLFAVPHMAQQEPAAAIPLFGVGVAFALFTIWRKSVVPAMIGHAIFNSLQILGVYLDSPEWT